MKFIHLSDLHIGKRVNEFSMLEDQKYILKVILGIIDEEKPDAVLIAGDVYDKSIPTAEAVQLLDDFLFFHSIFLTGYCGEQNTIGRKEQCKFGNTMILTELIAGCALLRIEGKLVFTALIIKLFGTRTIAGQHQRIGQILQMLFHRSFMPTMHMTSDARCVRSSRNLSLVSSSTLLFRQQSEQRS